MKRLNDLLDERIEIARITNSHGLNGEVKIFPYTNIEDLIYNLEEILLHNPKTRKFFFTKVIKVRPLNKLYILELQGVKNINDAKNLMGYEILIRQEEIPDVDDDEYYNFELEGMDVINEYNEHLGKVEKIIQTKFNDVIEVVKHFKNNEKKETLIPLINHYVININRAENIITVKKMEWYEDESKDTD